MYVDDYGKHYRDICEEPRNPNHPVYYCQECKVVIVHNEYVNYECNGEQLAIGNFHAQEHDAAKGCNLEQPVIAEIAEEIDEDLQLEIK
ncbi:unnamed protein product [Dovyalis caffra]|uniref:Uncharacterized protein n=1 Tax=Dovyalis caffra TaxID=77055 RepID=A0AAV1RWH3_9ROSI|nr:unnamed protein product [Dovyalis caffra]